MLSGALLRLMNYTSLSRSARLGPEDRAAIPFANRLRAWTLDGSLSAVWTHPANELARNTAASAIARALGLIVGTSDYLFLWASGAGVIEFKSEDGRLTPTQKDWRTWCEARGVRWALARSADEGEAVLRGWGVLV